MEDVSSVQIQLHFLRDQHIDDGSLWAHFAKCSRANPSVSVGARAVWALEWYLIRYKHVELSFPLDLALSMALPKLDLSNCAPGARVCASADGVNGTTFGARLLTRANYDRSIGINVPREDACRMLRFADEHAKKPFQHAFYQTFAFPVWPDGNTFYCVQFVVQCLQVGGLMRGVHPSALSGDGLLELATRYYVTRIVPRPAEIQEFAAQRSKGL